MSCVRVKDVLKKANELGHKECAIWLQSIHAYSDRASPRAYQHRVTSYVKQFKTLTKSQGRAGGKDRLNCFLEQEIDWPKKSTHLSQPKATSTTDSCESVYRDVAQDLAQEVQALQQQTESQKVVQNSLQDTVTELKKSRTQKSTVIQLRNEIKTLRKKVKVLYNRIAVKNANLRRIRLQNSRYSAKVKKLEDKLNTTLSSVKENQNDEMTAVRNRLKDSVTQLRETEKERDWLADIAEQDSECVSFYDEDCNKYSAGIRLCIYELLSLHVSSQNCAKVIRSVLHLLNKTVEKLPSPSTVLNMNVERLILSQKQLGEELPNNPNMTIYTDETAKFGTKYSGYHVSDSEGQMFVMGMRQLLTKSGHDTLSVFQEILRDLDDRSVEAELPSKKILVNISATMSDRASTEHKFNKLLEELRQTVLPELTDNWEALSIEDQLASSSLLNFFCGLHSLIHFAESANTAIIEVENGFFDGDRPVFNRSFLRSTESGAARLVRTASKALARGADEKSGKYKDFNHYVADFLKAKGLRSLPLHPFHGNRFNILFENSAAFFFLHEKIFEFLEGNQSNNLMKAVLFDIHVCEYVAGAKALGLISRLVTGPLWSLLEERSVHVLDMNGFYQQLVEFLSHATTNVQSFMSGEMLPFGDSTILKKDVLFTALISPWKHDDKVCVFLGVVLPALCQTAQKLFRDHLPGGCWQNSTEEMRLRASATQKHNKFAESVFGYLDQLLRKNPNISVLSSEAYIMFTSNRTKEWLESKTEEDRQNLVQTATRNVRKVRENFRERKEELRMKQLAALEEKMKRAEELEVKRMNRLQAYTDKIIFFGLYQSEESVDKARQEIHSVTEMKEALKSQLNFRKHVLKQIPPKECGDSVYSFSRKTGNGRSKQLTVDELTVNVKKLVQHAFTLPTECSPTQDEHVPILVGKHVQHKFVEEEEVKWWTGRVVSQVPGYPTWFNIVYEGDPAVYTYQLLQDWREGSLIVTVA